MDMTRGYQKACIDLAKECKELKEQVVNYGKDESLKLKRTIKINYPLVKQEVKDMKKLNAMLDDKLAYKNDELKRIRAKKDYYVSQNDKLKKKMKECEDKNGELHRMISNLQKEVSEKNAECATLENENEELRNGSNQHIEYLDGKYSNDLIECILELQSCNVSVKNTNPVLRACASLFGKTIGQLPSDTKIRNVLVQRGILSRMQLAETLPQKDHLCILSDETSKFGKKYEGFHASDSDGRLYVMGLRQLTTKSGKDALDALKEVLGDIENDGVGTGDTVLKQIVLNISSTMSDQAATQIKFNELLHEFKVEMAREEYKDQWENMTEEEKSSVSEIRNFFCALHLLVHLAECASKALMEAECGLFDEVPIHNKCFKKANEPGAVRLIRTACKAFARGGDDKNGAFDPFSTFCADTLQSNNMKSIPLERMRGSRFNILFSNASAVYFLIKEMETFLETQDSNNLLKSVKHDLQFLEFKAGVKALALVSHLICVPLWCLIERKDIHVLDMTSYYQELVRYINSAALNTEEFASASTTLSFLDMTHLEKNVQWHKLMEPDPVDSKMMIILSIMLPALAKTASHVLRDHMEDGKWEVVKADPHVREKTSCTAKHNKFSESVFADVDRLLREKPNISLIAQESIIMFTHNKTLDWLKSKESCEKEMLMKMSRQKVQQARCQFQTRVKAIKDAKLQLLHQKLEALKKKDEQKQKKHEGYTVEIVQFGLWNSKAEVTNALKSLPENMHIRAIKAQLNFRKHVLSQKVTNDEKKLFNFTKTREGRKSRVNLTAQELAGNLKELLD